jgi:peroxiredoxin
MNRIPYAAAVFGISILAIFTVFITWRAKALESALLLRAQTPALTNEMAPEFALPSLDGQTVSLADYKGKKKLIVSFWASWCGPCRLEMPALRAFYERYHKTSPNFEIVAISIDDDRAPAEAFATQAKLPFPVLLDLAGKTAAAYGVESIPLLYVIDESGRVIYAHVGFDMTLEIQLVLELGLKRGTNDGGETGGESSH